MLKAWVYFSSAFSARVWSLISPEKERACERGSLLLCRVVIAHLPMHGTHTNHAWSRSPTRGSWKFLALEDSFDDLLQICFFLLLHLQLPSLVQDHFLRECHLGWFCSTSAGLAWALFPRMALAECSHGATRDTFAWDLEGRCQVEKIGMGSLSPSHFQGTVVMSITASPLSGSSLGFSSALGISDLSDKGHQLLLWDIKVGDPQNWPGSSPWPWAQLVLALPHFKPILPSPLPALWALKPQHQMQIQQAYREGLTSSHNCKR